MLTVNMYHISFFKITTYFMFISKSVLTKSILEIMAFNVENERFLKIAKTNTRTFSIAFIFSISWEKFK